MYFALLFPSSGVTASLSSLSAWQILFLHPIDSTIVLKYNYSSDAEYLFVTEE